MPVVPAALMFRYRFAIPRVAGPPRGKSLAVNLPDEALIPFPSQLDGGPGFAQLKTGWHEQGLAFSLTVSGKTIKTVGDEESPEFSDCLLLWIDTRDTQSVHRATRFCHLMMLAPVGAGKGGKEPFARQLAVPRAGQEAPLFDTRTILLASDVRKDGYELNAWIPAKCLNGYDPEAQPRLGFYAVVRDAELGLSHLSIGEDFPYNGDPSLWASLDLVTQA